MLSINAMMIPQPIKPMELQGILHMVRELRSQTASNRIPVACIDHLCDLQLDVVSLMKRTVEFLPMLPI